MAAFCLLTWAYGLIVSLRFAFEQFIRPNLFPWVSQFVAWHHAWYWAAFLASAATLIPDLRALRQNRDGRAAGWLAVGYLVFFGAIGVRLLGSSYLVTLDGGDRPLTIVPGALLPLLWLAAIDHLGARFPRDERTPDSDRTAAALRRVSRHRCVGVAAARRSDGAAIRHFRWAWLPGWPPSRGRWHLMFGAALAVFVVASLVVSIAVTRRRAFEWEYAFAVALVAVAVTEFVGRFTSPRSPSGTLTPPPQPFRWAS